MSLNITNNKGLPQSLVDAIKHTDFVPAGSLSARKIYDAPQIAFLKKHHKLDTDASDMLWSIRKKAMLQVVENGSRKHRMRKAASMVNKELAELKDEILSNAGGGLFPDENGKEAYIRGLDATMTDLDTIVANDFAATPDEDLINQSFAISFEGVKFTVFKGQDNEFEDVRDIQIDTDIALYQPGSKTLWYLVECTTAASKKMELRKTWVLESNVQAAILRVNGYPVEKIKALMMFRDWNRGTMINSKGDYPSSETMTIDLEVKAQKAMETFIKERAIQYLRTEHGDIPQCGRADRWEDHPTYIVVRPKPPGSEMAQRPLKTAITEKEAVEWVAKNRYKYHDAYVETRSGESRRCQDYCPVRHVCDQWAKMKAEKQKYSPMIG